MKAFTGKVQGRGGKFAAPYDCYVLVTHDPAFQHEPTSPQLILVVNQDGVPQGYSGATRRAALELVLGREVTADEVIAQTRVGFIDGVAQIDTRTLTSSSTEPSTGTTVRPNRRRGPW